MSQKKSEINTAGGKFWQGLTNWVENSKLLWIFVLFGSANWVQSGVAAGGGVAGGVAGVARETSLWGGVDPRSLRFSIAKQFKKLFWASQQKQTKTEKINCWAKFCFEGKGAEERMGVHGYNERKLRMPIFF